MKSIREGDRLPIPCRPCGKILPTNLAPGNQEIRCPSCGKRTEISVIREVGELRVRTRPAPGIAQARESRTC